MNVRVHGIQVDFHWPDAMLVVEVDGRQHELPGRRLRDAERDRLLAAGGYEVLRFTAREVERHGARVHTIVRERLAHRRASASTTPAR